MGDLSESFKPGDIATASDAASDAVSKVATISDAASDALSKAYSRCATISDAASKAMSRANTQSDAASKALSKASDALSKVNAASDASSKALSKANVALSNASDAQSAATAYLDQSVKVAASPTFAATTIPTIHGYSWQAPVLDKDTLTWSVPTTMDFEEGNFTEWTSETDPNGYLAISTTTPHAGTYDAALRINLDNNTYLSQTIGPSTAYLDLTFWVKFDIASMTDDKQFVICELRGPTQACNITACKRNTGYVQLYFSFNANGCGDVLAYANFCNDSLWHSIRWAVQISATVGFDKVWFDDVSKLNSTGLNTGVTNIDTIRLGHTWVQTAQDHTIYYDDVSYSVSVLTFSPAAGDRYLISGVGAGTWTGKDNQIAHWTGTAWVYSTPAEGWVTWVEDENALYYYTGAAWAALYTGTYTFFDPDKFPASPTSQSDHFDDASIDGKWTAWQAGGSLTVSESDHHLRYTNTGDNAYTWRGHFQALPAGDFTITTKVNLIWSFVNYLSVGLALYEDAAANPNTSDVYAWTCEIPLGYVQTRITYLNAYNSWNSSPADKTHSYYCVPYLRIRRSGTTLYFEYSLNGIYWFQQYTVAQPFVPKEMGLIMMNYANTVTGYGLFDFFYYEAANNVLPLGGSRTVMLG